MKNNLGEVMAVDIACQRYSLDPFELINDSHDRLAIVAEFAFIAITEENRIAKEEQQKSEMGVNTPAQSWDNLINR